MELPTGAWDSHVHCFDPENIPFLSGRAYTPKPAKLEDLIANVATDHIMLVQASVEDGYTGLLETLKRARVEYPDKVLRGTIIADQTPERTLGLVKKEAFDDLHEAGVRSIRLHGIYGGDGSDSNWVQEQIRRVALLYPIRRYGWSISAQLPLSTWAALKGYILSSSELENVVMVSDHCGCATPSQFATPALNDFLELLSSGKLYVKISALHRRSPQDIDLMQPIVERFAANSPKRLLWGSDWPHVDASKRGLEPSDFLEGIDTDRELQLIKGWLSEEQWMDMLVTNPHHLYGA